MKDLLRAIDQWLTSDHWFWKPLDGFLDLLPRAVDGLANLTWKLMGPWAFVVWIGVAMFLVWKAFS